MRFETPLEEVAHTRMDFVEVFCVVAAQLLHAARKRRFWRREQKMVMIRHQHVGMKLPAVFVDYSYEDLEEFFSIRIVEEDQSLLDAATGHVPQGAGEFES